MRAITGLAIGLVTLAGALAACDSGFRKDPATQPGEPIVVVGANVGTNRPMPADGVVQIAFNRYLLPQSVIRQGVRIVDVNGRPIAPPTVVYDPVALTVTLSSPEPKGKPWLTEWQSYRVELGVPNGDEDTGGVRALDRATLKAAESIQFIVGPANGKERGEAAVSFCTDVLPIFFTKCGGGLCHGGTDTPKAPTNAAGLLLTTSSGVRNTALNRAAQGANTGALRKVGPENPDLERAVFGVNMALIKPKDPGNSWLMYKLLLAPPPALPPASPYALPLCKNRGPVLAGAYTPLADTKPPTDAEQQVLRDNVSGREMPYPTPSPRDYLELPLTFQERELVRLWIAQGADVPECGGCAEVTPPALDGGAGDAGASDAGAKDGGAD